MGPTVKAHILQRFGQSDTSGDARLTYGISFTSLLGNPKCDSQPDHEMTRLKLRNLAINSLKEVSVGPSTVAEVTG